MQSELGALPTDRLIQAEVCVVGAGAAGITLSRALLRRGHQVCLLEAGGPDYCAAGQSLYAGDNVGMPYYELDQSRLRFFGGTTNIWGGRCVPLAAIDYETRPWVPHSGWPLTAAELQPHLTAAHSELDLGEFEYSAELWSRLAATDPFTSTAQLETLFWRFDERRERFGWARAQSLRQDPAMNLLLGANLTAIELTASGDRIAQVQVRPLAGPTYRVRARHYVLACGGIENARLLLVANSGGNAAVGNRFDQVGRYFMEHPHARIGVASSERAFELWYAMRKRIGNAVAVPVAPALTLSAATQRQLGILNSAVTFKLQRDSELGISTDKRIYLKLKHDLAPGRTQRRLWHLYRSARNLFQQTLRPALERVKVAAGRTRLNLILRAEQAPNPDSRVRLSSRCDALGMPRAELDWQLTELDKRSATAFARALNENFEALGYGSIEPSAWLAEPGLSWPVDPTVSNHPIGGYHHIGTTRMSSDPRHGVVDSDCTVHGCSNLHIAGSSVFPTAGWANPTLTILALALRQSEHLSAALQRPD